MMPLDEFEDPMKRADPVYQPEETDVVSETWPPDSEHKLVHATHHYIKFYASYVYMSMYTYFDRDDVAYSGMAAFFKKSSDEEREHGEKLIKYQNKRGGKVVFQDIAKPSSMEWGSPLDAL